MLMMLLLSVRRRSALSIRRWNENIKKKRRRRRENWEDFCWAAKSDTTTLNILFFSVSVLGNELDSRWRKNGSISKKANAYCVITSSFPSSLSFRFALLYLNQKLKSPQSPLCNENVSFLNVVTPSVWHFTWYWMTSFVGSWTSALAAVRWAGRHGNCNGNPRSLWKNLNLLSVSSPSRLVKIIVKLSFVLSVFVVYDFSVKWRNISLKFFSGEFSRFKFYGDFRYICLLFQHHFSSRNRILLADQEWCEWVVMLSIEKFHLTSHPTNNVCVWSVQWVFKQ